MSIIRMPREQARSHSSSARSRASDESKSRATFPGTAFAVSSRVVRDRISCGFRISSTSRQSDLQEGLPPAKVCVCGFGIDHRLMPSTRVSKDA